MLKTKVIAVAVLTVFLASVAVVSVSGQTTHPTFNTSLVIYGNGQFTQPGRSITVSGGLNSGVSHLSGMTVNVYAQRLGTFSINEHVKAKATLVATTTTDEYGSWGYDALSVTFKQQGIYGVYATFDGATGPDGNYYSPSKSEIMVVKVTNVPPSLVPHKPTLIFAGTASADHQMAKVGDNVWLFTVLRSFGRTGPAFNVGHADLYGKTVALYYQYKSLGSNTWGTPTLVGTGVSGPADLSFEFKVTQPGYYRFQTTFAGDPWWKVAGYDASASNYIDVLVTN